MISNALQTMRMADYSGRYRPHVEGMSYHGPGEGDTPTPQHATKYQELVGALKYVFDCTRPHYIEFYVSRHSAGAQTSVMRDWLLTKHLLRYLNHTMQNCIVQHSIDRTDDNTL